MVLAVTLVKVFFGCIIFADDLLLLSPSLSGIQHNLWPNYDGFMLRVCKIALSCIIIGLMLRSLVVV